MVIVSLFTRVSIYIKLKFRHLWHYLYLKEYMSPCEKQSWCTENCTRPLMLCYLQLKPKAVYTHSSPIACSPCSGRRRWGSTPTSVALIVWCLIFMCLPLLHLLSLLPFVMISHLHLTRLVLMVFISWHIGRIKWTRIGLWVMSITIVRCNHKDVVITM